MYCIKLVSTGLNKLNALGFTLTGNLLAAGIDILFFDRGRAAK
jgi:hypothetical protein